VDATALPPASSPPSQVGGDTRTVRGFALASVMAALLLTVLLEALDQTVVGTAMPKIIATLQGFDRYTWVITAYLLTSTVVTPIAGKLSDQFGRKWFLLGGSMLFLVGSLLAGAAQTMTALIVFRAVQGLGAGIGIALAMTVVGDLFPPAERAKWQGIVASAYAVSSVIGPFLGGWLADHGPLVGSFVTDQTRWRWVFYVNLPVGLLAVAALLVYLPARLTLHSAGHTGWAAMRRIDFPGALFAAAATVCLLLGLTWGGEQTYAWNSPQVIGMLAGAAVLYVAFFVAERFAVEPILPLGLFRNQVFAADSALSLAAGMAFVPLFVYLPLFLQGVLGESATNAGLVSTPMSVSVVIGAFLATGLIAKLRRYQAITFVGGCVFTVGVFLLTRMTPATSLFQAGLFMVVAGIGLGTFFAVMTLIAQNAVPQAQLGVATSSIRYLQALGSTIGAAIIGTVVNNSLAAELANRIPASTAERLTPAGLKYATNPQVLVSPEYRDSVVHTAQQFAVGAATQGVAPGPQHDAIAQQVSQQTATLLGQVFGVVRDALAIALQHGFVVVLVFCGLCLLAILFLKDVPMAHTTPAETVEDASEEPVLTH
jgi:EmrB/QacA subfamily drug resistance transporter